MGFNQFWHQQAIDSHGGVKFAIFKERLQKDLFDLEDLFIDTTNDGRWDGQSGKDLNFSFKPEKPYYAIFDKDWNIVDYGTANDIDNAGSSYRLDFRVRAGASTTIKSSGLFNAYRTSDGYAWADAYGSLIPVDRSGVLLTDLKSKEFHLTELHQRFRKSSTLGGKWRDTTSFDAAFEKVYNSGLLKFYFTIPLKGVAPKDRGIDYNDYDKGTPIRWSEKNGEGSFESSHPTSQFVDSNAITLTGLYSKNMSMSVRGKNGSWLDLSVVDSIRGSDLMQLIYTKETQAIDPNTIYTFISLEEWGQYAHNLKPDAYVRVNLTVEKTE